MTCYLMCTNLHVPLFERGQSNLVLIRLISLTRGPPTLLEYSRLYTDFMSEWLIFAYQQPYHRIDKNQQCHRKAAM